MVYNALYPDDAAERSFRDRIEAMLRAGNPSAAEREVRGALEHLRTAGHPLAARCLAIDHRGIVVEGWDTLVHLDPSITALGVDMSWPGHISASPDSRGSLDPVIETNYYSDAAFPFSTADRAELNGGYTAYGSEWRGEFEAIDVVIRITGIGHLYGPVYLLDTARQGPFQPSLDRDMAVAGACFVAVLVHRAVRSTVARRGLPRPLTVMVGSNESYPFFDAAVITREEFGALVPAPVWKPVASKSKQAAPQSEKAAPQPEQAASSDDRKARTAAMTPEEMEEALHRGIDVLPIRDERTRGIMRNAATLVVMTAALRSPRRS